MADGEVRVETISSLPIGLSHPSWSTGRVYGQIGPRTIDRHFGRVVKALAC